MNIHQDKGSVNKSQTDSAAQSTEGKATCQLRDNRPQSVAQKKQVEAMAGGSPVQKKGNNTGLPDQLKSGIENLSGRSMDDVKVHYNSDKPAQLNAHAYAQGTNIHVASGQEKHLPHEAWHVVQQKEGRVKPTIQMKGKVNVNDDEGLEKEADVMGAKATQLKTTNSYPADTNVIKQALGQPQSNSADNPLQLHKYEMVRSLPLTVKAKEKDTKDARIKYIDALRRKYPIKGDVNAPDEGRGENFLREKMAMDEEMTSSGTHIVKSAHVAGIDMGARKRSGTAANKAKKFFGGDWIGAHLVKDAWGGLDNMMNVVVWPDAAEKKWSEGFEDPIDDEFLYGKTKAAHMTIEVTKEDEFIGKNVLSKQLPKETDKPANKWMHQEAEKIRWGINRAIETIPVAARGSSTLTKPLVINPNETGYGDATHMTHKIIEDTIKDIKDGVNKVHINALTAAKTRKEIKGKLKGERSAERKKAIIDERKNLKPDIFHQNIEDIGEDEY